MAQAESPPDAAATRSAAIWWTFRPAGWAPLVAATWFPIRAMADVAAALAGRQTNVSVTLGLSLSLTVGALAAAAVAWVKAHSGSEELKRLRARSQRLESENKTLRAENKTLRASVRRAGT